MTILRFILQKKFPLAWCESSEFRNFSHQQRWQNSYRKVFIDYLLAMLLIVLFLSLIFYLFFYVNSDHNILTLKAIAKILGAGFFSATIITLVIFWLNARTSKCYFFGRGGGGGG